MAPPDVNANSGCSGFTNFFSGWCVVPLVISMNGMMVPSPAFATMTVKPALASFPTVGTYFAPMSANVYLRADCMFDYVIAYNIIS